MLRVHREVNRRKPLYIAAVHKRERTFRQARTNSAEFIAGLRGAVRGNNPARATTRRISFGRADEYNFGNDSFDLSDDGVQQAGNFVPRKYTAQSQNLAQGD